MRQFIRGERAKLSDLAAINHIWEIEVSVAAPFFIVDFCCLGLDESGQVVDDRYLISLNRPEAPQDAISLDNASNNGAIFTLNLGRLSQSVRRLVFTATLHQPEMPGGLLGAAFSMLGGLNNDVGEGFLVLRTPAIETGFFAFSGEDFGEESTLILGELYWRDEWRFVAAGQPLKGELSVFLQSLTDGPMPAPVPTLAPSLRPVVPAPATAPMAAPPRPPRPAPAPKPPAPAPSLRPAAPVPARVSPRVVSPPQATVQPAVQSIAPPVAPPAKPAVATPAPAPPVFPQSLPPGTTLQDLIDAAASGSTLTLVRDEYQGPITINKPLSLEGQGSALWAKTGPVVTVSAANVSLHDLDIEVTLAPQAPNDAGVALKIDKSAPQLQLDNVRVRGRISGLGDEDGEWILPALLDLGQFAPRAASDFTFSVRVPTAVLLSSPVEGVSVVPTEVGAGEHQITLQVRDVAPEALLVGFLEVRSASLLRTIPLSGNAVVGIAPKTGFSLDSA